MKYDPYKNWYQGCGKTLEGSEADKKSQLTAIEKGAAPIVAQDKLDGEWVQVGGGSNLVVQNRKGNPIKNHGLHSFPDGCLIIGELAHGSQTGKKRKEAAGHGLCDTFDILFFNFEYFGDLPPLERRKRLERWHRKLRYGAPKHYPLLEVWADRFVERYNDADEGLVLKSMANGSVGTYKAGTKSPDWWKAKKEIDVDMVVMGVTFSGAATKTSVPMCKNIIAGLYIGGKLVEICKPGAMDNATSVEVAADFKFNGGKKFLGKVVRVHGFAPRFDSGSVRHPSFNGWNDSKPATDCTWDPDA